MHSGPVTGGVLRGERARFQLFGDTVNTASRIESCGKREKVHLSEQTAELLVKHGKEDWLIRRDDVVEAKGKGQLVTYWLKLSGHKRGGGSVAAGSEHEEEKIVGSTPGPNVESNEWNVDMAFSQPHENKQRNDRLAEWNSEILIELLQRVVSHRAALSRMTPVRQTSPAQLTAAACCIGDGPMVVDEVVEIIDMPDFVCTANTQVQLSDVVERQLRDFVTHISMLYNDNPFHNFEHASHVTMSINKLLGRIVAVPPKKSHSVFRRRGGDGFDDASTDSNDRFNYESNDDDDVSDIDDEDAEQQQAAYLHDHTCGITSDPLTQFAVVLSGLLHDLDHPGVSNGQLIMEKPKLAAQYAGKSVAEQNSVDLAWTILMSSDYAALRAAIFATETELRRFRSLLVNSIIATDIFDKDQSTLRKNRWNKAFYETTPLDDPREVKSRKATIVIEHLIQASDVAHTMQHWHVYQKWNQCLFNEMMMAFKDGRADKDPSVGWYNGELWFFDNYVIPLAKKLKDCGVFGVSSDEYLNYAVQNRHEWHTKGEEVVRQYIKAYEDSTRRQGQRTCDDTARLTV
jgi:3'5'-cyclic nucleotide phosphodiesterase/Adenylate and Guanylate cyclase catalytic domain